VNRKSKEQPCSLVQNLTRVSWTEKCNFFNSKWNNSQVSFPFKKILSHPGFFYPKGKTFWSKLPYRFVFSCDLSLASRILLVLLKKRVSQKSYKTRLPHQFERVQFSFTKRKECKLEYLFLLLFLRYDQENSDSSVPTLGYHSLVRLFGSLRSEYVQNFCAMYKAYEPQLLPFPANAA
jgi:hypothetical protein